MAERQRQKQAMGFGVASTLRGGEGSADRHGENRRTEIWATKVRSEVRAGMDRRIGAFTANAGARTSSAQESGNAELGVAVSGPAAASTRRWELQAASWMSTRSAVNNMQGRAAMPGAARSGTNAAKSLQLRQETRAWPC